MVKEVQLPNSWKNVTLKTYLKISSILEGNHDFKTRMAKIVSCFSGLTEDEVFALDMNTFNKIAECLNFLKEKPKPRLPEDKITLNGNLYSVAIFPQKWLAAQFLDYQALAETNLDDKLQRLLAVFVIPKGHKYNDGYDFDEVVSDIDYIGVQEALGFMDFFQLQFKAFAAAFLRYSARKLKRLRQIPKQERKLMEKALKQEARNLDSLKPSGN